MECNAPKVKHFKHKFVDINCSRCGMFLRQVRSDVYADLKKHKEYRRMLKSGLCETCTTKEFIEEVS